MVKLNTNTSVVDYLKSTGKNSSYDNRSVLAKQYKINNYAGTQAQNVQLLNALKASQAKPVAPKAVTPVKTVKTPVKTVAKPTTPKPTGFDQTAFLNGMNSQINSMYDARQASQLAALQAQQNKALGQLNQQKAELAPQYQGARNQSDVVNAQNVQRLRELMGSQGLNASGENVTAQTALNNQRLNSLNALNLQEQQANYDINRQISDVNDPAKQQAIMNDIASQRSQALLDAYNRANDVGYQRQQDTLANARADASLTGMYNGKPTFANQTAAKDAAWQKYIYGNLSADQKAQLGLSKYQIDTGNQTDIGSNQALINYYKSLGFNSSKGGSGAVPQSFQQDMAQAVQKGVPAEWAPVLSEIVRRESSYNPNAKNPTSTAYGYGQFLDSTRKAYEKKTGLNYNDPVNQLIMMAQYVKDRYKTPQRALQFWKDNQYY